jgi:integrase
MSENLTEYDSTKIWLKHLGIKSNGTRKAYLSAFSRFIDWIKMSPDDLREEKYSETKSAKPWEQSKVENKVREFLEYRQQNNIFCKTLKLDLTSIKSFFKANGLTLNIDNSEIPKGCGFGSKVPTHDEIRSLVEAAEDIRLKSLLLFLKDTGLRISDAVKVKWKDLKDYGNGFYGMKIITEKKNVPARPFFGPETTRIIFLYKKKREMGTEKIPPEQNIDEHPIFAQLCNPDEPINVMHIAVYFNKLTRLLGYTDLSAHGLRKFWEQNFKVEHPAIAKQFNGRTLTGDERAYHYKTDEQLFDIYKKNYDNLRIYRFEIGKQYLTPVEFKEAMAKFLGTEEGKQFLLEAIRNTIVPSDVTSEILKKLFEKT